MAIGAVGQIRGRINLAPNGRKAHSNEAWVSHAIGASLTWSISTFLQPASMNPTLLVLYVKALRVGMTANRRLAPMSSLLACYSRLLFGAPGRSFR